MACGGGIRGVVIRWIVFMSLILCSCVFSQVLVTKKASAILSSIPIVSVPSCTHNVLLNDVEARARYLALRIKNTRFFVYSIRPGDNLWVIAKRHGCSLHSIIGTNPQLKTYDVSLNQKILLPSSDGSLHPIQNSDTWQKIAERYDVDEKMLQDVNFGILTLVPHEYVFIPGKRAVIDLMNKDMRIKYELRSLFKSPLTGKFSSNFGKRRHPVTGKASFHDGVDIAVPPGSRVAASADGVVTVASHNVGHYGTAVFIDHKNGYVTQYGHLSSICVKVGQKVKKGQLIAKSGGTGRVTGPHLHFTIKKGDTPLNPRKFIW